SCRSSRRRWMRMAPGRSPSRTTPSSWLRPWSGSAWPGPRNRSCGGTARTP
ncbi:unnamed protein product, partial [Effrenium voratum]